MENPHIKDFTDHSFYYKLVGGLVAPSGMFLMQDTKAYIGNFIDERFKNIFNSERYWKIMEYLSSRV